MKRSVKNYALLCILVLVILLLGYYRDFVFKTLNFILQARDYETSYTPPASLAFLDQYRDGTLMNLKWLLTVLFCIAYLLITLATLHILFNKKKYTRIAVGVYAVIILFSGFFMLIGYTMNGLSERMYEFARYLMGMAQSPLILMILIPAFKLSGQEPNNITN